MCQPSLFCVTSNATARARVSPVSGSASVTCRSSVQAKCGWLTLSMLIVIPSRDESDCSHAAFSLPGDMKTERAAIHTTSSSVGNRQNARNAARHQVLLILRFMNILVQCKHGSKFRGQLVRVRRLNLEP